jgi:hypothetical protein
MEHDGCLEPDGTLRMDYTPENLTVDIPSFVELAGIQFELQRRSIWQSFTGTRKLSKVK